MLLYRFYQDINGTGFSNQVVGAKGVDPTLRLGRWHRGVHDNRNVAPPFVETNLLDKLKPIHLWHEEIGDDQVRFLLRKGGDGLHPVGGGALCRMY